MSANRIILKGSEFCSYEEFDADAALSPGHLLERTATGVKKHATVGGLYSGLVALEDALQGKTIDDAYAEDDKVNTAVIPRGVIVNGRIAAGENIAVGDLLMSNGAGALVELDSQGQSVLYDNVARSASVENTITETAFDKSYTIPANFLRVGDVLRVRVAVTVIDNNSTDTLLLKLKIGSTVVVATAAVDVADADVGYIDAQFVVRTIGATGTLVATGLAGLGVPSTVTGKAFYLASTTVDTTGTLAITVTATWSVAHADNEAALDILTVSLERTDKGQVVAVAEETNDNSAGVTEAFSAVRFV